MAWTAPRTWAAGELVVYDTGPGLNEQIRDNLLVLDVHAHDGTPGGGGQTLGDLVKMTYTDAVAPSAPAAGLTSFFSTSGRFWYRPNGGAAVQLADADDLHAEDHATRHEPGGGDAMAVDEAAGTGSLRTLSTGSTNAAAGDHGH